MKVGWVSVERIAARPILADDHDLCIDVTTGLSPGRDVLALKDAVMKIADRGVATESGGLPQSSELEESFGFHRITRPKVLKSCYIALR